MASAAFYQDFFFLPTAVFSKYEGGYKKRPVVGPHAFS
jgi:hypothetical protein